MHMLNDVMLFETLWLMQIESRQPGLPETDDVLFEFTPVVEVARRDLKSLEVRSPATSLT